MAQKNRRGVLFCTAYPSPAPACPVHAGILVFQGKVISIIYTGMKKEGVMNKCGSKEKIVKTPAGTPVNKEKDVCVMAGSSAEHARFDGSDLPCDDARGTVEQTANKTRRD